jgi:hypothetical protein
VNSNFEADLDDAAVKAVVMVYVIPFLSVLVAGVPTEGSVKFAVVKPLVPANV